jgi:hypothetical protein
MRLRGRICVLLTPPDTLRTPGSRVYQSERVNEVVEPLLVELAHPEFEEVFEPRPVITPER